MQLMWNYIHSATFNTLLFTIAAMELFKYVKYYEQKQKMRISNSNDYIIENNH